MNITRENFEDNFDTVCKAIRASHFVAVDAEFTGANEAPIFISPMCTPKPFISTLLPTVLVSIINSAEGGGRMSLIARAIRCLVHVFIMVSGFTRIRLSGSSADFSSLICSRRLELHPIALRSLNTSGQDMDKIISIQILCTLEVQAYQVFACVCKKKMHRVYSINCVC